MPAMAVAVPMQSPSVPAPVQPRDDSEIARRHLTPMPQPCVGRMRLQQGWSSQVALATVVVGAVPAVGGPVAYAAPMKVTAPARFAVAPRITCSSSVNRLPFTSLANGTHDSTSITKGPPAYARLAVATQQLLTLPTSDTSAARANPSPAALGVSDSLRIQPPSWAEVLRDLERLELCLYYERQSKAQLHEMCRLEMATQQEMHDRDVAALEQMLEQTAQERDALAKRVASWEARDKMVETAPSSPRDSTLDGWSETQSSATDTAFGSSCVLSARLVVAAVAPESSNGTD